MDIRKAKATAPPRSRRNVMDPRQVKSDADAKAIIEQRDLSHIKVGVFDIDGIMRGKYMSRAKFISALSKRLRLLRCGARAGLSGPALRQREIHRLAHRLPRCARAHTSRNVPARCRTKTTGCSFLSEFTGEAARKSVRAAPSVACSIAHRKWASRPYAGFEYEVFFFNENTRVGAREALSQSEADGAGMGFGYSCHS